MKTRHLISLNELSGKEILKLVKLSRKIKKRPHNFERKLKNKTLLMVFSKPSLRTHLSFDVAMNKLGGHAIFYSLESSTLGKKESIKDFSKVISMYVNIVMARLHEHKDIQEIAKHSDVPIINGLTNAYHPCQIIGDFLTIKEKLGNLKKVKIAYIGDANNNVAHSLIVGCKKIGAELVISCPKKKEFMPNFRLVGKIGYKINHDPKSAVKKADVIYADSWMSYHISKSREKSRARALKPYQVNSKLFNSNKKALFMHCLPAKRGQEVTDEVIDSKRSIVYDQAENRMWSEMAILLRLLGRK